MTAAEEKTWSVSRWRQIAWQFLFVFVLFFSHPFLSPRFGVFTPVLFFYENEWYVSLEQKILLWKPPPPASNINENMKKKVEVRRQKKEKTKPSWGCLMCKCLALVCFDSWGTPFVSEQNIKHVTADLREDIIKKKKLEPLCGLAFKFAAK